MEAVSVCAKFDENFRKCWLSPRSRINNWDHTQDISVISINYIKLGSEVMHSVRGFDETDKFVAFGRECCGFESSNHRPTSPLDSRLLAAACFLDMMYTAVSLMKESKNRDED